MLAEDYHRHLQKMVSILQRYYQRGFPAPRESYDDLRVIVKEHPLMAHLHDLNVVELFATFASSSIAILNPLKRPPIGMKIFFCNNNPYGLLILTLALHYLSSSFFPFPLRAQTVGGRRRFRSFDAFAFRPHSVARGSARFHPPPLHRRASRPSRPSFVEPLVSSPSDGGRSRPMSKAVFPRGAN